MIALGHFLLLNGLAYSYAYRISQFLHLFFCLARTEHLAHR